jgi:hypothetical protein
LSWGRSARLAAGPVCEPSIVTSPLGLCWAAEDEAHKEPARAAD